MDKGIALTALVVGVTAYFFSPTAAVLLLVLVVTPLIVLLQQKKPQATKLQDPIKTPGKKDDPLLATPAQVEKLVSLPSQVTLGRKKNEECKETQPTNSEFVKDSTVQSVNQLTHIDRLEALPLLNQKLNTVVESQNQDKAKPIETKPLPEEAPSVPLPIFSPDEESSKTHPETQTVMQPPVQFAHNLLPQQNTEQSSGKHLHKPETKLQFQMAPPSEKLVPISQTPQVLRDPKPKPDSDPDPEPESKLEAKPEILQPEIVKPLKGDSKIDVSQKLIGDIDNVIEQLVEEEFAPAPEPEFTDEERDAQRRAARLAQEYYETQHRVVVIDAGSDTCKVAMPQMHFNDTFPTCIGRPKRTDVNIGGRVDIGHKALYVGNEIPQNELRRLKLSSPIKAGLINPGSWADMEKIWEYIFEGVLPAYGSSSDFSVVLVEPPMNPKQIRTKITQVMFEHHQVHALYLASAPVLSAFATGCPTGVVLEAGHGISYSVPVYEGHLLPHGLVRMQVSGKDLTDYLLTLLGRRGYNFYNSADIQLVREIKERLCFLTLEFDQEFSQMNHNMYCEKIGSQMVPFGKDLCMCPEALFQPTKLLELKHHTPGVHEVIFQSVLQCPEWIQNTMWANVVIAGGSTTFKGFSERLQKELTSLVSSSKSSLSAPVQVKAIPHRTHAAVKGGAALAGSCKFSGRWISSDLFDYYGPSIVNVMCFPFI
jgi:actin-related protein